MGEWWKFEPANERSRVRCSPSPLLATLNNKFIIIISSSFYSPHVTNPVTKSRKTAHISSMWNKFELDKKVQYNVTLPITKKMKKLSFAVAG